MRAAIADTLRSIGLTAGFCLIAMTSFCPADEPAPAAGASQKKPEADVPFVNLFDAVRDGDVAVSAEGTGDGRMSLSVTNRTNRKLRVVLPPGLIASGASGQFGGMGGMGGGMGGMGGGMGGMGGGMGGMGGGMGGMGGGMGGMGGGMGGRGGMMGGGGTMPASMGMMMLGRLIMSLVGDRDSWDMSSLMSGMMMGMGGGMGMGGMGGGMGMGGMGGGMGMGGGGGGFRSIPPTGLPFATLNSKQTRHLPTRLVGLSEPDDDARIAPPKKGEPLRIGEVGQVTDDARVQKALRRMAADKAPQSVAQLVLWSVSSDLKWDDIAKMSKDWANAQELTLARDFVARMDRLGDDQTGALVFEVKGAAEADEALAAELSTALKGQMVLGLKATAGVPASPTGPAIACKVKIDGTEGSVQVAASDGPARAWAAAGKFTVPLTRTKTGALDAAAVADAMAGGILDRLVRAQLSAGPRAKGKPTYKIKIENASPLILNGLAVHGKDVEDADPKVLAGISIAPMRSMTVPASEDVVKTLGLRKGIRVVAADLSGL